MAYSFSKITMQMLARDSDQLQFLLKNMVMLVIHCFPWPLVSPASFSVSRSEPTTPQSAFRIPLDTPVLLHRTSTAFGRHVASSLSRGVKLQSTWPRVPEGAAPCHHLPAHCGTRCSS